ncbi:MAG: phospholipase [Planctomycetes bacterium]|nr:phospholipase [Planctomycetota bacterium]
MAVSNGLQFLHELHLKLKAVQEELEKGPRLIKAKENGLAKRQAELDQAKAKHTDQRKLADQKSLQLKTNEAKLADLNTKLNMASTNREFDILKGQIAADKMANSVLEDEILDCMEQVDTLKNKITEAEKLVAEAKDDVRKMTEQVTTAQAGLKDRAEKLHPAVAEAESVIPTDHIATYRRLVQAHGAEALSVVENNVCTSCNVSLSPQQGVELRSGKLIFCISCGRLMYAAAK